MLMLIPVIGVLVITISNLNVIDFILPHAVIEHLAKPLFYFITSLFLVINPCPPSPITEDPHYPQTHKSSGIINTQSIGRVCDGNNKNVQLKPTVDNVDCHC